MTKEEREAALAETASACLYQLGGRADIQDVARHVASAMGQGRYEALTWSGFVALVRNALRRTDEDSGLPSALSLNGEYVQTVLMDVEEFRCAVKQYMSRSRSNRAMAVKFVEQCFEHHGVDISDELSAAA